MTFGVLAQISSYLPHFRASWLASILVIGQPNDIMRPFSLNHKLLVSILLSRLSIIHFALNVESCNPWTALKKLGEQSTD